MISYCIATYCMSVLSFDYCSLSHREPASVGNREKSESLLWKGQFELKWRNGLELPDRFMLPTRYCVTTAMFKNALKWKRCLMNIALNIVWLCTWKVFFLNFTWWQREKHCPKTSVSVNKRIRRTLSILCVILNMMNWKYQSKMTAR